jgi:hypothetical protein
VSEQATTRVLKTINDLTTHQKNAASSLNSHQTSGGNSMKEVRQVRPTASFDDGDDDDVPLAFVKAAHSAKATNVISPQVSQHPKASDKPAPDSNSKSKDKKSVSQQEPKQISEINGKEKKENKAQKRDRNVSDWAEIDRNLKLNSSTSSLKTWKSWASSNTPLIFFLGATAVIIGCRFETRLQNMNAMETNDLFLIISVAELLRNSLLRIGIAL